MDISHLYELYTGQNFANILLGPEYAEFLRDHHVWSRVLLLMRILGKSCAVELDEQEIYSYRWNVVAHSNVSFV